MDDELLFILIVIVGILLCVASPWCIEIYTWVKGKSESLFRVLRLKE
ncbi:MAG: hypothetical protein G01um10148_672 [Parcubacteria group bacterium Gr01-1014_8]|nr:MAG: hypothetical protein G01um10148_672 [Parcubacteria group bacterium Gr01-1014_8]